MVNDGAMVTAIEQHGELLRELAVHISREATATDPDWIEAFFDFRLDTPECGVDRTILRTKSARKGILPPTEMTQVRDCLWQLRDSVPGGMWYGLFVLVDRDGNVDVKYDHYPDCIETFAEDEKAHRPF